jgi:hypothetical protein
VELNKEFADHLRTRYKITEKTEFDYLGMEIHQLTDGSKTFQRPKQLERIFEQWLDATTTQKRFSTPMAANYEQMRNEEGIPQCNITEFQSLIGGLLQLLDVRPDISAALSRAAQYTTTANECDMKALLRVAQYLYCTRVLVLILRPGHVVKNQRMFVRLRAYDDAAYGCMRDGRSKLAYSFDLVPVDDPEVDTETSAQVQSGTGMFFSKSKISDTACMSSTEAEHSSVVECVKTLIMYRGIMEEIHQQQLVPTPVFNDNKSNVTLANEYSGNFSRVRYFLPRVTWLLDQVKSGTCKLLYKETGELVADAETKPLQAADFLKKRALRLGQGHDQGLGATSARDSEDGSV